MAKNYNARINVVYEFLCAKPGYFKKSYDIISKLTDETNSEVIRLAKEFCNKANSSRPVETKLD